MQSSMVAAWACSFAELSRVRTVVLFGGYRGEQKMLIHWYVLALLERSRLVAVEHNLACTVETLTA